MDEPNAMASPTIVLRVETENKTPQLEQLQPLNHNENINEPKLSINNITTPKDSTKQPSDKPQNVDRKTKKIIPNDYTVKNFNNKNNISARDTNNLMHPDNKKNTVNDIIVKAELVNKAVVMHAQTKENNHLEIVKKQTKPTIKILSRDTHKTLSSSVDNVNNKNLLPLNKQTLSQAAKKTSGARKEKMKNVNPVKLVKKPIVSEAGTAITVPVQNDQLTYAQMVGPAKTLVAMDEVKTNDTTEKQDRIKDEKATVNQKPPEPESPKMAVWQTVRPKGKKRIHATHDAEQTNWDDVPSFDQDLQTVATPSVLHHDKTIPNKDSKPSKINSKPKEKVPKKIKPILNEVTEQPVLVDEIIVKPKSESIKIEHTSSADENVTDPVATTKSKINKSKTDKAKKPKAKKQVTKDTSPVKEMALKKMDKSSIATITDNDASLDFKDILGDVDISNFSFDPNSSMFVNALYSETEKMISGTPNKSSAGFSLNNSLTLMKPFGKTKENIFLKEEEEMVIRVMNSINQKSKKDDDNFLDESQNKTDEIIADKCNDILVENGNISVDDTQCLTDDESVDNSINDYGGDLDQNSVKDDDDAVTVIENLTIELDSNGDIVDEFAPNGTHNNDDDNDNVCINNVPDDKNQCQFTDELMPDENYDNNNRKEANDGLINEICSTVNGHCKNNNNKTFEELFNANRTQVIEILSKEIFNTNDIDEILQDCQEPNHPNKTTNFQKDNASPLKTNGSLLQESDLDDDDNDDNDDDNNLSSLSSENNDEKTIIESQVNEDCTSTIDDLQNDNEIKTTNAETIFIKSMSQEPINESLIIIKSSNSPSNDVQTEFNVQSINNNTPPENGDGKFINFYENEPKRNQSPRHSEDSGILEYQDNMDDMKYFSDTCEETASKTMIDIEHKSGAEENEIKFPVTEAVSRWLMQKQKERSPEPLLRLPDNPMLTEQIGKTLKHRLYIGDLFNDDDLNSDSDTEYEFKQTKSSGNGSKNLIGNPLHVLFARNNIENTYKRVADGKSVQFMEPDLLDGWNVGDKRQQSMHADVLNENATEIQMNHNEHIDLDTYESLYGHSINYANLLLPNNGNDMIFLSNNIRNYNDKNDHRNKPFNENNTNNNISNSIVGNNDNVINSDKQLLRDTKSNNNRMDNINDKNLNSTNLNCFKPPEICCILM